VGARGKIHLLHGVFEIAFAFGIELAMSTDLFGAHGGVGGELVDFEAVDLNLPGG